MNTQTVPRIATYYYVYSPGPLFALGRAGKQLLIVLASVIPICLSSLNHKLADACIVGVATKPECLLWVLKDF